MSYTLHTSRSLAEAKKLETYMDPNYIVGNRWETVFDGGDSLQRTGFLAFCEFFGKDPERARAEFEARLAHHKVGPGLYVRYKGPEQPWTQNLNVTSGDQLRPNAAAMALYGMRSELRTLALRLLLRGGFYWNTRDTGQTNTEKFKMPDWSGPEHWATYIRGLSLPERILLYPILLLGDFVGLVSTLWATFVYPYQRIKNCDQLNRIVVLTHGLVQSPTFLSRLSHYIFKRWRPVYSLTIIHYNGLPIDKFFRDMKSRTMDPSTHIVDTYFWNQPDPPLQIKWYPVARKFWKII